VHAEHFQPTVVSFGFMPEKVRAFDLTSRPFVLSEIDQTGALGAKDVHPKAQSFPFSVNVHSPQ
jgi:hypothetical protein